MNREITNVDAPAIEVRHADLQRCSSESPFKSKCPSCENGMLLLYRGINGQLQEVDRCIACGQTVRYLDIADLRKLDSAGIDNKT